MTTPFDAQIMAGKIYARTPRFDRAVKFATEGLERLSELAPRWYVAISFGKQSICLAHLAQSIKHDVPLYFLASTETWSMFNYQEVIDDYVAKYNPNLTIVQTDHLETGKTWKQSRDAGDKDLQKMCDEKDWDGWAWGLSMDESKPRRITIATGIRQRNGHPSIYQYGSGKYRCCPLMKWEIQDLAAYIATHNLKMLNVYEKYGLTQRTTARFTKQAVEFGAANMARQLNPKMCRVTSVIPEIKA